MSLYKIKVTAHAQTVKVKNENSSKMHGSCLHFIIAVHDNFNDSGSVIRYFHDCRGNR